MTDEQEPLLTKGDPLGDMIDFSGAPKSLGEARDYGFKIMKARMLEIIHQETERLSPMLRGTARTFYGRALDDAFNVFAQCVEQSTDEELTPG